MGKNFHLCLELLLNVYDILHRISINMQIHVNKSIFCFKPYSIEMTYNLVTYSSSILIKKVLKYSLQFLEKAC